MTARLLVAALWLVALAMQPLAFDLLALKRSALLIAAVPLLFTRDLAAALSRPLAGPLRLAGLAAALAIPLTVLGRAATRDLAGAIPDSAVAIQALIELSWFVMAALLAREVAWERATTLLRGVAGLGGCLALLALLQATGIVPCDGLGTTGVAVATFGNSNAFAAFASPCLAVAVAFAARAAGGAGGAVATVLLAAALVAARGRGGVLAAAIGVIAALTVAARTGQRWRRGAAALLVGVTLGCGAAALAERGDGSGEASRRPLGLGLERASNLVRLDVARATLDLVAEAPVLGHGAGGFRDAYPRHRLMREAQTRTREGAASEVDHPHNEWLRLAADHGGAVALLLALCWIGALLAAATGPLVARADDGSLRSAALGGAAAWCAASLTWSTLHDPPCALLGALLLGVAVAGVPEVNVLAAPRGRLLSLLLRGALATGAVALGFRTPLAEWREWRLLTGRHHELSEFAAIAELDSLNVERQSALGAKLLAESREQPALRPLVLPIVRDCFDRALRLFPHHAGALAGRAAVAAAQDDQPAARWFLQRLHRLEPWRGDVSAALAGLLLEGGAPVEAARLRLEAEGERAVGPLQEEVRAALAAGRPRLAAELCELLEAAAPDDPESPRLAAAAWRDLGDERAWRRAFIRAQIDYALGSLGEGDGATARQSLTLARERLTELRGLAATSGLPADGSGDGATLAAAATVELLDATVDLQQSRTEAALERLRNLDPAAARAARAAASPLLRRWLRMLGQAAPLAAEGRRLGLAD